MLALLALAVPRARHGYPFPTRMPSRVIERDTVDKLPVSGRPFTPLFLYEVRGR